jgi:hypothetical protein
VAQQQLQDALAAAHQVRSDQLARLCQVGAASNVADGTATGVSAPAISWRNRRSQSRRSDWLARPTRAGVLPGAIT